MPVARLLVRGDDTKFQVDLLGPKNDLNLIFSTPDFFLETTFRLYRNGVRQESGAGCDYVVSESGGAGTGFDTVTFFDRPPIVDENLFADYRVA